MRALAMTGMVLFSLAMLAGSCNAQQVIVLDGLGGLASRNLQPEVNRLTNLGYDVTYRPWWRWRNAARVAPNASRVIGYSMGGPRAIRVTSRTNASQLELLDPFSRTPMIAPPGTATTVYRAAGPTVIRSTPVYGNFQQYQLPTNHAGIPGAFRP